jgi:FkbH-like protein
MNLSTRRLTERELMSWAGEEGHQLWTLRVSDKFGNYGLTGLVSVERDGSRSRIVDFVLSCRVMGRGIEETMLHLVVEWARSKGLSEVLAGYRSTPKNKPCYDFLARSGMQTMNDRDFAWNAAREYMAQSHIRLVRVDRETNLPG